MVFGKSKALLINKNNNFIYKIDIEEALKYCNFEYREKNYQEKN